MNDKRIKLRDFLSLPYEEKVKFLWGNYKAGILAVFVGLVLLAAAVGAVKDLKKTTVMAGITVNVELSEAGKAYLTDAYKEKLQAGKKEMVYLGKAEIHYLDTTLNHNDNYYAAMSLASLCYNQEVDYLLLDQEGFEVMLLQDVYLDLQKVYTQEELELLGETVVFAQNNDQAAPRPIALKITDSPFIQENTDVAGEVYFAYAAASPRTEACRELFEYLLAWKSKE